MNDLLLLAKAFALREKAKVVAMPHLLEALSYVEVQGDNAALMRPLNAKTSAPDPAIDAESMVIRAGDACKLPLDGQVRNWVRKFETVGLDVRLKNVAGYRLPSALATAARIRSRLEADLQGQPAVVEAISVYLAGHGHDDKGLRGVYVFAGPPGSGKSHAAHLLADALGGYRIWEYDCAGIDSAIERFAFDGSRSAFQGASPGELTSYVRLNPKSVIVLDHFEKMNPLVHSFLAPLLETGWLTDQYGFFEDDNKNKSQIASPDVDFRQCHLILCVESGEDLYDAPALLARLEREGGEGRVASALLASLRRAHNPLSQPPGPCFSSPVLSRLASQGALCLFRRLDWAALTSIARNSLRLAVQHFESTHDVCVDIDGSEDLTRLLVLEHGGQVDARRVGLQSLSRRLFEPVIRHSLKTRCWWSRIAITVTDEASIALADILHALSADPVKTLLRTMKRVELDIDVSIQGETIALSVVNPRLVKIVSADDFQGDAALLIEAPDVRFNDVAGMDKVKAEMRRHARQLRDWASLREQGLRPAGGLLVYGPPGTGKTMLAKALAHEAGLPFLAVTGAQMLDLGFQQRVFDRLKRYAPAILFIDELDALGHRRQAFNPAVNALLAAIDGISSQIGEPIFVVGATNFPPERIDPALLRPGRIELKFEIGPLDRQARRKLLSPLKDRLSADEIEPLVDFSAGLSGAQLVAAMREMQLAEALDGHGARDALEWVAFGERVDYAQGMRESIAYHEAGHAVVHIVNGVSRVDYVSLTAREADAGHVWTSRDTISAVGIQATRSILAALMAGRVAQRLRFAEAGIDNGDASDLKQATRLAYEAVAHWGLDPEVGAVHLTPTDSGIRMPDLEKQVEARVRIWLSQAEDDAKALLNAHWPAVEAVAAALLDQGALAHDALYALVTEASPEACNERRKP